MKKHDFKPVKKDTKGARGRKNLFAAGMVCVFGIAAGIGFAFYESSMVYGECYMEAGVEVNIQDFLKKPDEQAFFAVDSDPIDTTVPGDYHLKIKTGLFSHKSILHITDTIAPVGQPVKVKLELGKECGAEAFVTDVADATKVTFTYVQAPDFSRPGEQSVEILLTDLGQNQSRVSSVLFVSKVVDELTVEAGSPPPEFRAFVIEGEEGEFVSPVRSYDYSVPSDYTVSLRVDGVLYEAQLHIVDTIAPTLKVHNVQGFTLLPRNPEDFVVSVEDATKITLSFGEEPDVTLAGEQTVEIWAVDAGGNGTVETVSLILEEDTQAPVISGVSDISVFTGETVSYKKNVTVTDNCPDGLQLTVDNSAVNLSAEGTYPIIYTARDYAGNETSVSANITVKPRVYDEYEVYALADQVLDQIITPEMTPLEKVQAIYRYNQTHIAYANHSEKDNWVRAAYEGLVDQKGDCYVYACTAKVLLTRAGIANIDIVKIPTRTNHYWNLVNIGDGWYHFDTTPRVSDHPYICMWTEEQLMAYSAIHYGSHNYDHSLYPEVN